MKRTIFPSYQKFEYKHRPTGRKPKLNPELSKKIVTSIKMGNYVDVAALAAGISREQIKMWLYEGAKGNKRYKQFTEDVQKAIAESEERDLAMIDAAAMNGFWAAAAWKLERKFPNRWGKIQKVEMTGQDGGPIETTAKMDLGKLSIEQLQQLKQIVTTALNQGSELVPVGGNG